jgi:hypothetical protein
LVNPNWAIEYRSEVWVTLDRRLLDLLPGLVKASAVQLAESSQHHLGVIPCPTSPRATHPKMDDVLAPTFHRAAANRVTLSPKLVVAHASQVGLEVAGGLTYLIGDWTLLHLQGMQGAYNRPSFASPEIVEIGFYPLSWPNILIRCNLHWLFFFSGNNPKGLVD